MGEVAFLAPCGPQWLWPETDAMCALRRVLGNESPFGWCDFVTRTEAEGPVAEFCDHFGPVVRFRRAGRRYEVACLRTGASNRAANLNRAAALIRLRWNAGLRTLPIHSLGQAG